MPTELNSKMRLMDIVTVYLYWPLDLKIHMKVPEDLRSLVRIKITSYIVFAYSGHYTG